jgi:hypothetical protein
VQTMGIELARNYFVCTGIDQKDQLSSANN